MKITVKLNASLKKYANGGENGVVTLEIPPMDIEGLIKHLGIDRLNTGIVLINGKNSDYSTNICDNDFIQILTELKGG